jgi:hypothetical protein
VLPDSASRFGVLTYRQKPVSVFVRFRAAANYVPIRFQRMKILLLKETLETKIFLEGFSPKDSVQRLCILESYQY